MMGPAAAEQGEHARCTVGFIETRPGSPNTVPGLLRFTVDVRHPDAARYQALKSAVHDITHLGLKHQGLQGEVRCVWEAPGVSFDPSCVDAVRQATGQLGFPAMEMVSGAGHDSCNLNTKIPAAMIFVPCKDGVSHNELEDATQADCTAGANVLLHTVLSLAGVASK